MKLPLNPHGGGGGRPSAPPPKPEDEQAKKAKALSDALRAKSDGMKMVNDNR